MSQDRMTALRLLSYCWLTVMLQPSTLAFNVVYNKEQSSSSSLQSSDFHQTGSRKFGGYRIVPRACKDDTHPYKNDASVTTPTGTGTGTGVCMFNYECTQLGGSVVGSCVDVFLFGACCRLPAGVKVPAAIEHSASTAPAATAATPGPHHNDLPPLSFQQPVADTILMHRNGSAVQNTYRPDDLFGNFTAMMQAHRDRLPQASDMTDVVQQYTTDGGYHQYNHHQNRPLPFAGNKITSKVDYGDTATVKLQTSQSPPYSSSSSSPVSKSTDSVPNIRKTTPSAATVQATTSKQGYGGAHHNHHKPQHPSAADDYYDNMVLIPTLTVNDPNVKENNSIHHILSILNYTPPSPDRNNVDPMDASPSYHHMQSSSPPPSLPPALYTWGSIDGDSKSPGYGASTFPVTRPSSTIYSSTPAQQHYDRPTSYYGSTPSTTTTTSSHHLPGPHFHVLSTTTTAKPLEQVAPTVIVLSPANDSKNPNNKYTTPSSTVYTAASYRPPPSSHVKPSQSIIVTGKPSVSAAYTTTATYHHPQHQHQQDAAFVPVSSTTMADKYYNANYQPTTGIHTSAKPLVSTNYGHRPSSTTTTTTTTTTGPPPTLSSSLHHDAGTNNNVFTTVITSVNHQYHKYQPSAAGNGGSGSHSTAKPVVNDGGAVAVLSSGGGYRPTSTVDDDYPTPVVTPATQVFITASDVHHLQQHHIQQQLHHHLQHHTSSSSYPVTSVHGSTADDDVGAVPFNSTDTFAFPPVRDPNVNLTAASQQEKPDVTVVDSAGDYDADAEPNPQLTVDDNLDDKVHLFVEKVVQSLQGNFEDLEKVLLSGDPSSSNITIGNDDPAGWPTKKPATAAPTAATPTKKPAKPAAAKPTKPSPQPVKWTSTTTYQPTPIVNSLLDSAPYLELTTVSRPTKYPTLLTPVQLFQPTTYATDNKRPTKLPVKHTPSTTVVLDTLNVDHDYHTTAEPDYRKTCGVRPLVRKSGRIVGGTGSTFGEWPWQVLVREATWLGLFTKNKCGGVLITQRHVITAAHCQPGFLANLVAVFGEYDISGEVESKRSISKNVKRVIVHRQYDAATFENDIALLELESPVSYDQHIVPICMPDDEDDFTGRMAVVTGWGRLKYGGGVPSILQEVQVPIIENQVCQDMFETAGHTKSILSSFLCAGYANGQRDSCEGDSGGPLMIEKDNGRWTLIGTVSHGIKCAAPYLPGVYMRTTYYKPWLQTITGVQ